MGEFYDIINRTLSRRPLSMNKFKNKLYGDGIHDDYPAIQEMIDSGACEVSLPAPKKHYVISKTLLLPSNFRLVLPRFAEIKLADGANCAMVRNRGVYAPASRLPEEYYLRAVRRMKERIARGDKMENNSMEDARNHVYCFNYYVDEMSPEPWDANVNIELCGGIWNCNNLGQFQIHSGSSQTVSGTATTSVSSPIPSVITSIPLRALRARR